MHGGSLPGHRGVTRGTAVCLTAAVLALPWVTGCRAGEPLVKQRPAQRVLFRGVKVLDTVAARWMDGPRDVLVDRGVVTRMEPSLPGEQADVVYQGGTLVPGLTDAHVHVHGNGTPPWKNTLPDEKRNLQAFLAAGVTTVMDMGAMDFTARELGARVLAGELPGPRILAAGPMFTAPGGHPVDTLHRLAPWPLAGWVSSHMCRQVSVPSDVAAPMKEVLAGNPDYVKVVLNRLPVPETPRLEPATVKAIVEAAHAGGKKVFVHVGSSRDALDAVNAGADVLAHGVQRDALTDEALDALVARGVAVIPTTSVFRAVERMGLPPVPAFTALERHIAGEEVVAAFRPLPADPDPGMVSWIRDVAAHRDVAMENTRRMLARGVTVLVGSDSANAGHFAGAGLHDELDLLVEAGMSPARVLSTAARGNLLAWGRMPDAGEVAAGKPADLFWVKGDVEADFSAVHDVRAVITRGALWEPAW